MNILWDNGVIDYEELIIWVRNEIFEIKIWRCSFICILLRIRVKLGEKIGGKKLIIIRSKDDIIERCEYLFMGEYI